MDPQLRVPIEDENEDESVLNLSADLDFLEVNTEWGEPVVFTGLVNGWQDGLNATLELLDVKRNHADAEVDGYLLKVALLLNQN